MCLSQNLLELVFEQIDEDKNEEDLFDGNEDDELELKRIVERAEFVVQDVGYVQFSTMGGCSRMYEKLLESSNPIY